MKALILAAGYAVRLQPLTLDTPKPLLTIGGKKIIDRILGKVLKVKGIDTVYVVANHRFFQNFEEWLKNYVYKNKISLIDDGTVSNETRLGAIKDLELAIEKKSIEDDLLVVAGDNLFELELDRFLDFTKKHPDGVSIALYDIGDIGAAKKFGVVKKGKDDIIAEFEEKPEKPKSTLISTGIYYFPKETLKYIKEYIGLGTKLDAPGYYIQWLIKTHKVYGFSFSQQWYDIGDIESYKRADAEYKQKGE